MILMASHISSIFTSTPSTLSPLHSRLSVYTPSNPNNCLRNSVLKMVAFCLRAQSGDVEATTEWLKKLPDKNKTLYSHSLPHIEAGLIQLGFHQSKDDRAVWFIEKPEWRTQLSLDVTDLHIRYLKSGHGDLDKDVDRRFSYALSREDIEKNKLRLTTIIMCSFSFSCHYKLYLHLTTDIKFKVNI